MKLKNIVWLLLASIFGVPSASFAHHGPGQFNGGDIEVTGVVTRLRLVNPHAYIYFDVMDEQGNAVPWRCELQAGSLLRRAGWTEDLFPVGGEITVKGSAGTDERTACALQTVVLADGRTLDRYGQLREHIDAPEGSVERVVDGKLDLNGTWAAPQRRPQGGSGDAGGPPGGRPGGPGGPPGGPRGGGPLPGGIELTEAGMAAVERHGGEGNPRHSCKATNIFFDWTFDRHVNEIIQTQDSIAVKYGLMDIERTIYLNMEEHPSNINPSRAGHSIGRWEDGALVVDTVGFAEGFLVVGRVVHSEQMHVTERFTYDAETQSLSREYSAVDPKMFTGTYSGQDEVFASDVPFEAYACVELKDDFIQPTSSD